MGDFGRDGPSFVLVLVVEHGDGNFSRMMVHQFPDAVLEGRAGIVHLVDKEDFLARELAFGFLDPLDLPWKLGRLVVGVVVGNADGEDGLAEKCPDDPRGNKAACADGDDDVGIESRFLDAQGHAFRRFMDFLIAEIALFHERIVRQVAGLGNARAPEACRKTVLAHIGMGRIQCRP